MPYVTTPPQPVHFQPSPIDVRRSGHRQIDTDLGELDLIRCDHLSGEYVEKQKLDETGTLLVYPDFKLTAEETQNGRVEFDGLRGRLLGVHAHERNEHVLDKHTAKLKDDPKYSEIHFVFEIIKDELSLVEPYKEDVAAAANGVKEPSGLMVVGALLKLPRDLKPKAPATFGTIAGMPSGQSQPVDFSRVVEWIEEKDRYVYDGSLTSPNYSEAVRWVLCAKAIDDVTVAEGLRDFLRLCAQPARAAKPLGRRFLLRTPGNGTKPAAPPVAKTTPRGKNKGKGKNA